MTDLTPEEFVRIGDTLFGRRGLTLAEFLLARIAEDEEMAGRVASYLEPHGSRVEVFLSRTETLPDGSRRGTSETLAPYDPARVLAECEAKRRIVEQWNGWVTGPPDDLPVDGSARYTLRHLALPYTDHPDYDERWRP